MANTVENTFKKIGNTIEHIFNGGSIKQPETNVNSQGKASNLEMYGMQARSYHLLRNEWKKDLQYTRALVNAEYMVQTEFKISGGESEPITESKTDRKINQLKEKKNKLETQINNLEGKKERLK